MNDDPDVDLDFSLDSRTAIVTGGASGIGAAIAAAYIAKGARVAIVDASGEGADRQASALGERAVGRRCDVTDDGSVTTCVAELAEQLGRIDVLVNCAGVARLAPAEELALSDWDLTLAVNLTGVFRMCQVVGRIMLAQGNGKVISIASQAASVALDQHAAYCASKFGLVGLTKVLASEWAGRGVTANTISPTVVLTDLGRQAWSGEQWRSAQGADPDRQIRLSG